MSRADEGDKIPMRMNACAAKTQLSRSSSASSRARIIITKYRKPVARVASIWKEGRGVPGSAAGQIVFRNGWDRPMSERELKWFLGG
jgi:hypothetical protein